MKSFNQLSFASSEMVNNTTSVVGGNGSTSKAFGTKRPELVVCFPTTPGTSAIVTKPVLGVKHH
jgi:hypothetical protein